MEYVKSSNIEAISYLKKEKKLRIYFKNGSVYQWSRVPVSKYNALLEAESKGKYFNEKIKGTHTSRKIKGKDEVFTDIKGFFDLE